MLKVTPLLILILLSACSRNGAVGSNGCDWTKPIIVDPTDVLSRPTAEQILTHNESGRTICGWSNGG